MTWRFSEAEVTLLLESHLTECWPAPVDAAAGSGRWGRRPAETALQAEDSRTADRTGTRTRRRPAGSCRGWAPPGTAGGHHTLNSPLNYIHVQMGGWKTQCDGKHVRVVWDDCFYTLVWDTNNTSTHTGRRCDLVFTSHLSANKDFEKLHYT